MLTDLTPPSKETIWQTGLKRKIQQSVVYKETHLIDKNNHWLRVKGWKKIYQANAPPKQAGVAILISGKVNFKFTLIKKDTNKMGSTPKGNNNYQPICTQFQCTQFHQTYTKGLKSTYRLQHSGSWRI
jgi:hypothetical protein